MPGPVFDETNFSFIVIWPIVHVSNYKALSCAGDWKTMLLVEIGYNKT